MKVMQEAKNEQKIQNNQKFFFFFQNNQKLAMDII